MLDSHPQRLTLFRSPCVQRRLHGLQYLTDSCCIRLPTKYLPRSPTALLEPQPDDVNEFVGDIPPIPPLKRRLVVVKQALQDCEQRLEGYTYVDTGIHDPRFRTDAVLVFESVTLQDGYHVGYGKHGF